MLVTVKDSHQHCSLSGSMSVCVSDWVIGSSLATAVCTHTYSYRLQPKLMACESNVVCILGTVRTV